MTVTGTDTEEPTTLDLAMMKGSRPRQKENEQEMKVTVERHGKVLVIHPSGVVRGDKICSKYTQKPLRGSKPDGERR